MKVLTGIGSTTHIDLHNERMAIESLYVMADQINERYIPYLIEHDLNKHVGVVLYGEVFQLNDGEHALGTVTGVFENEEERERFKTGKPNIVWQDYKKLLCIDDLIKMHDENRKNRIGEPIRKNSAEKNLADFLETHLDSTQVHPDGTVYKVKRFIAATGDLRIEVYPKDHDPAHFHVISKQRRINARFTIDTLDLLETDEGEIGQNDIKKIQDFFKKSQWALEELRTEHKRMQ